jgi:hypothetical protein
MIHTPAFAPTSGLMLGSFVHPAAFVVVFACSGVTNVRIRRLPA